MSQSVRKTQNSELTECPGCERSTLVLYGGEEWSEYFCPECFAKIIHENYEIE